MIELRRCMTGIYAYMYVYIYVIICVSIYHCILHIHLVIIWGYEDLIDGDAKARIYDPL